jgi:hypothetical protein
MKTEVKLKFERATKNTYVFRAETEGSVIDTLYIRKTAFESQPEEIKVTVESS